jgi:hypothetical protein
MTKRELIQAAMEALSGEGVFNRAAVARKCVDTVLDVLACDDLERVERAAESLWTEEDEYRRTTTHYAPIPLSEAHPAKREALGAVASRALEAAGPYVVVIEEGWTLTEEETLVAAEACETMSSALSRTVAFKADHDRLRTAAQRLRQRLAVMGS